LAVHSVIVVFRRDLKLAFRRVSEWANPLLFFVAVTAMFPLALDPARFAGFGDGSTLYGLQSLGIGVLWMTALLSSLMGLDRLFLNDVEDGSMEQLLLSPVPLIAVVYGKLAAHWLVSGLPLIVLVPIVGVIYQLPLGASLMLAAALVLATPTLTVLIAIGAALTINLKSAAAIVGLLVLPLCAPILIFGARATVLALDAESAAGPLYFLAALATLAVTLGPLAIAAALRVGNE
jgi:heme exporter protein B